MANALDTQCAPHSNSRVRRDGCTHGMKHAPETEKAKKGTRERRVPQGNHVLPEESRETELLLEEGAKPDSEG